MSHPNTERDKRVRELESRTVVLLDLARFLRENRSVCDFMSGIRADLRDEWRTILNHVKDAEANSIPDA